MEKMTIILMREPYGDMNAAEAVRHALGGMSGDFDISLVLADRGVLLALKDQAEGDTGFTNLGDSLKDCVDKDITVYAEDASIERAHLNNDDLIGGIKVISSKEVSGLLNEADQTLIY